ncbi:hypothetical protein FHX68_2230 [Microbacterium lacticum]|uniref:Uncharacterized protein n=2 Tax=Microbacterium lacticum TaxID=33885 RepID=A0A543KSY4_9MICO|nr:hypothetical protein FHX68_2230 [Microbacterium lacticum]
MAALLLLHDSGVGPVGVAALLGPRLTFVAGGVLGVAVMIVVGVRLALGRRAPSAPTPAEGPAAAPPHAEGMPGRSAPARSSAPLSGA